ncbi:hypothetical protein [Streptomyces sp. NBC_00503]|uniref:hypothetical protein n=1 Tax=Streptomyces sp. NBC_00503 TaxID=2903659 RepID=UPI002E80EB67|nr:hypothetical protein [Streptomyces sp. NBC_00503]WUD82498.1 hypothetical protein OG490_19230 [Streptomyces sp. NBC_00503]
MARMSLRTKLASVVATGVMVLGTGVLAATPAQADSTQCPDGYACIYWGTTADSGIRNMWATYGAHKLYFYSGRHLVDNNQTDGWKIWLCRNNNGTNCDYAVYQDHTAVIDMTPFNSVSIEP